MPPVLIVPVPVNVLMNRNRPGPCSVSMTELAGHVKTSREQNSHHYPGLKSQELFFEIFVRMIPVPMISTRIFVRIPYAATIPVPG